MDTDVLIVGAGPTGLMLANQLARRGVRASIIDRHSGPAMQTRALGVQARTLEIYSSLGVVDRALELGKRANGANLWAQGRKTAHVPLGDAGRDLTPYPYILILGQDDNERIMGDRLRDFGMSVQWNTELVALTQQEGGVEATLKLPDGTSRKMTAAWVAGCDGAHSAVRELSGITFPGAPYEHVFYVSDTEVTGSMVADEVNVYLWRSGFHLFFPMRGDRPLADRRHPAREPAEPRERQIRRRDAVAAQRSGREPRDQGMHMVLDLPHRAPRRVAFSSGPLLCPRRRRAHPQPGRRAGHEYRAAGRVQPRVEARAGRRRQGRRGAARFLRGGAHPRRAAPARHDRPRVPPRRLRQLAGGTPAHRSHRPARRAGDDLRADPEVRVSHDFANRDRVPLELGVEVARWSFQATGHAQAIASHGCSSSSASMGRSRTSSAGSTIRISI